MDILSSTVFSGVDYGVFITMLVISLSIGLYFGFCGKRVNTTSEYLHGSKKMQTIPVAISLISSQVSGVLLMSYPADIYGFGTQTFMKTLIMPLVMLILIKVFIPVFFVTNVSNAYEYLELRFDRKIRKITSFLFVVIAISYGPIISFIPALAFSQVSNVNVHVINSVVVGVCIIYTMLGGIKAVVWTDVVQTGVMVTACVVVSVFGILSVGGIKTVFERASAGNRLELFNMDPSLTARQTFWNQILSSTFWWSAHVGLNQVSVQRLIALPTFNHAKRALIIFCAGVMLLISMNTLTGLIIYAWYHECDPLKAGMIPKADSLVPYFVMDSVGHLTGIPGIFIASIFSAGLSTISAQLNSLSGIIYGDFVRPSKLFKHTEVRANLFMKVTVVIAGILCILGGFVVSNAGSIYQMVISITSITLGISAGVFTLGMLTPWANTKGALYGSIASLIIMAWIVIGAQISLKNGSMSYPRLPTSVEGCANGTILIANQTLKAAGASKHIEEPFFLYKLSFNLYILSTMLIVWIVGLIVSFITGPTDPRLLGKNVFARCIHWLLPKDMIEEIPTTDDFDLNDVDHKKRVNLNRNSDKYKTNNKNIPMETLLPKENL